ncbi:MAG: hypothetical protein ACFE8A_14830 [Candidatus Hodarchaeota archaeon]
MKEHFFDFWLFSKDGLPIAEFIGEQALDKSILGGLVSAIKIFSQQITSKGLQSLLLEDNKFTFISALEGSAILVCRTSSKVKEKKIQKICNNIVKIFEELYTPNDIINWNGEVSFFDKFREKLENYIK